MAWFDKQVFQKGIASLFGGLDLGSLGTSAAVTLEVNVTTGSDTTGNGSLATPYKTIGKALAVAPFLAAHAIQINLAAGTYPELLNVTHVLASTGKVTITGAWQNFIPATGPSSGTFDASFAEPLANTAKLTGATWTVNDLKGKFLQITSGALTGRYIPIASNTADTLDISAAANTGTYNLQSVSFVIVEQSVTLARDSVGGQTQAIMWVSNNPTDFTAANGVTLENVKVDLTGLTNSGIRVQQGVFHLRQCMTFTGSGAPTALFPSGRHTRITVTDSYVSSGAGAFVISAASCSQVTLDGLIVDGGAVGLSATTNCTVTTSTGQAMIQNCTTAGMSFTQSYLTGGRAVIRSCGIGIRLFGQCRLTPSNFVVQGNTAAGVHFQNGGGLNDNGSVLQTSGWSITGNGTAGITLDSSHNWVYLGSTTVSTNATWGVQASNAKGGGFNQVSTTSATVMSGNTSGDFSIDGSTAISLATLRADGDKDMLDPVRVNRLFEY